MEELEAYSNEFEALRAAMIIEMAEQRTYARYAEEASNAEMQRFFNHLARYKAMHIQSLKAQMKTSSTTGEIDGGLSSSSGSSVDDAYAVDGNTGPDLTQYQFVLSITENEVKMLESANEELLKERLRHEEELAIAADIQMRLLPQEFPQDMGVQIAASSAMAKAVGGDYYDLTTNRRGELSLIVADSMGKGIPAALLMATLRAIWRGCSATCCRSPGQVLETINRTMYPDLRATESFVTMFGAIYDPETSVFRYSSAGHNPAIFCQSSEAEHDLLDMGGLPMGVLPDSKYPSGEVFIHEGDIIVMYTDGVVEAEGDGDELFGLKRLCDVIYQHRGSDAGGIKDIVLSEVNSHTSGSPLTDDTTVMVLKKV